MSFEMPKCKITVLKRTINQDLIDEYLDDEYQGIGLCDCFRDGQEIVIEDYSVVPEGFCASAWADIRKDILAVAMGAICPGSSNLALSSPVARIGSGRSYSS
jgi:uncharacterized repeat protein (TIGR04076 family)